MTLTLPLLPPSSLSNVLVLMKEKKSLNLTNDYDFKETEDEFGKCSWFKKIQVLKKY